MPEDSAADRYKDAGFPHVPDFFARAMRTHSSPGLKYPWYSVFSHHTPDSMNNLLLEPGNPEIRHAGWDVENLLTRFPNVLAWVNGHTHTNTITLKAGAVPERCFWEINTASHVDYPQHARVIEVVDNADESNVGADADHNTELLLVNPLS